MALRLGEESSGGSVRRIASRGLFIEALLKFAESGNNSTVVVPAGMSVAPLPANAAVKR